MRDVERGISRKTHINIFRQQLIGDFIFLEEIKVSRSSGDGRSEKEPEEPIKNPRIYQSPLILTYSVPFVFSFSFAQIPPRITNPQPSILLASGHAAKEILEPTKYVPPSKGTNGSLLWHSDGFLAENLRCCKPPHTPGNSNTNGGHPQEVMTKGSCHVCWYI